MSEGSMFLERVTVTVTFSVYDVKTIFHYDSDKHRNSPAVNI